MSRSWYNDNDDFDADEGPSKSELKRQMEELQALGKKLTQLTKEQLAQVPMSETLEKAIVEHKRLKQGEALRRHMQYIGKLMRTEDSEGIQAVVDRFDASSHAYVQHFHMLERWRDRLLNEGNETITEIINHYPDMDAQHLRQLVRNAKQEAARGKAPTSSRKLFTYIREIVERSL
ncbi:ribosome biogenesis factor YjgA [Pokkaliibacter sp. CJK22405]|uniref:ribosome biogenesis factor YjgA n=1 Tax=Pokkaliibacter sp. CJK22405 TaxID=3384615 RepID=UPI0039849095